MKDENEQVVKLLLQMQGFDVSKFDENFLNKSSKSRAVETNSRPMDAYNQLPDGNTGKGTNFIHPMSISYSEFFRNSMTFSALERIVLPVIVHQRLNSQRPEIRIWSAACASGQESYSIAILLKEVIGNKNINFRIFATDLSDEQIEYAHKGNYSSSEIGYMSLNRLNRWFVKHGNVYSVKDELKEQIEFSTFDLLNDQYSCPPASIFGDFDLIFCANILFYYKPEFRTFILKKTSSSLSKNGFFITGETEREILLQHHFQEAYPHSAIFTV